MRHRWLGLILIVLLSACGAEQAASPDTAAAPGGSAARPASRPANAATATSRPTVQAPADTPTLTAHPTAPATPTTPSTSTPDYALPTVQACAPGTAGSYLWPARTLGTFAIEPGITRLYKHGVFEIYLADGAGNFMRISNGGIEAPDSGGGGASTPITVRGKPGQAYEGAYDRIVSWEEDGSAIYVSAGVANGPSTAELVDFAAGLESLDSAAWCARLAALP